MSVLRRGFSARVIFSLVCSLIIALVLQPTIAAAHVSQSTNRSASKEIAGLRVPQQNEKWFWVTAQQVFNDPNAPPTIGVGAAFGQYQPIVDQNDPGDTHSLAQLGVTDSISNAMNALEFGWVVAPAAYNNSVNPYLFVVTRSPNDHLCTVQKDAQGNWTCDYHQTSSSRYPGMPVEVTDTPQEYAVEHYQGNWWIWYQDEYIGFIPDAQWGGALTQVNGVQWFGEVSSGIGKSYPCSQMGNGRFGSEDYSAVINNMSYITYDGQTPIPAKAQLLPPTDPNLYDAGHFSPSADSFNSFTYGGPGGCVA